MTRTRGDDNNPTGVNAGLDILTEQRHARLRKGHAMHGFKDAALLAWEPAAQAAALWERAKYLQERADYWKRRAERSEARMLEHHCATPKPTTNNHTKGA